MRHVQTPPLVSPDYRAAREALAHRVRDSAVFDVTGEERVSFLQGQLTQDVRDLSPGHTRLTAGLTPKGKLLFIARLVGLPDRLRLLVPKVLRARVLDHLEKYAVFQKVTISDRSEEVSRIGLYGPGSAKFACDPAAPDGLRLAGEGEIAAELLLPASDADGVLRALTAAGSVLVSAESAEILRVEAGRPRFGMDADESHLPDEVGLEAAISTTKGCYVGQEIVARLRTYGRVNKRLVGFRFPEGLIPAGSLLKKPEEAEPGKIEMGRVTSTALSPALGAIGLGFAFRDASEGSRLVAASDSRLSALVHRLPFA